MTSTPAVQFPPEPVPADRPRAKVLIVDDDERNAFAATQALEALGQELVVARSGPEALRKLLHDDFAVILLDLHMPGMDGYETAALIRERRRTRDVPIVFLTAVFRDEGHIFKAYSAGAVDVVFKPVDPFILRSKVQVLVDLHLKRVELAQELENRQRLLEENARVQAEKLEAERSLQASLRRQQAIQRALPIVFYSRMAERPYTAISVSDSMKGLTGFDAEDFVNNHKFGYSRVHPDDQAIVARAQVEALEAGAYTCEYRLQCADGTYKSVIDQGILSEDPDTGGAVVFGTLLDNTERRALEEALGHARKMETVGQLTGGVAHDFNNLLTAIQLRLDELLHRHPVGDPSYEGLNEIRQTGVRAADLVRKLLAFSRKQTVQREVLDLGELISEFEVLLRRLLREDVKLITDYGRDLPKVRADKSQLETAVMNLAVNARDAVRAAKGGGIVRIRTARLTRDEAIGLGFPAAEGDVAFIEVSDDGPGIPPDVMGKIFDPFFTTKPVGEGTGLGLATVYGIVKQSDGWIHVHSRPGEGAAFRIFLPIYDAPAGVAAVQAAAEPVKPRAARDLSGAGRILFVEDEDAVRSVAARLLRARGYEVLEAADGEEALIIAEEHAGTIDLLISDVIMPGIDGPTLLKKARGYLGNAPVMFISGYAEAEFSDLLEGETGVTFLPKPIDIKTLAERVKQQLQAA